MSYNQIILPSRCLAPAILIVLLITVLSATAEQETPTTTDRLARTDSVGEKLRLIQQASDQHNYDLALSLAESLKETLGCEKQLRAAPGQPHVDVDTIQTTDQLPLAWATWARGWKYVQTVTLRESANLNRRQEPIDLRLAVRADQSTDLHREIRVAKVETSTARLQEIPSQVYGAVRRGSRRQCHLVFFADVPAGESVTYLIFHGNPLAERPHYPTDLQVAGDPFAREITNHHYVATLSEQMGQLERLRYTRQHGLELYAGGKGHGEPPTIDWSNDYVDQDHFQKLRIRNWSQPPNYEVVRGPLVVRVRRWGFPHSPIHPVFTPSRMHIDQTYVFYAGHDYFLKEGVMEGIKDFDFAAMRDDEWVFSGYSFNRKVWIDSQGKLQEGEVTQKESTSMKGVGFYHHASRDALIALWLEHTIEGYDQIEENGIPRLHYHQHGQLWSRYPVGSGKLHFERGTVLWQKNAYLVAPYPQQGADRQIEGLRNRLLQPLQMTAGEIPHPKEINSTDGQLARQGETESAAPLKKEIWQALRKVQDEQLYKIDANVVDMGYIYDVQIKEGVAEILLTMPHRGRPVYQYFVTQGGGHTTEGIREQLLRLDGVREVLVHFTWEPAWTIERLTDAGRQSLGLEVSR